MPTPSGHHIAPFHFPHSICLYLKLHCSFFAHILFFCLWKLHRSGTLSVSGAGSAGAPDISPVAIDTSGFSLQASAKFCLRLPQACCSCSEAGWRCQRLLTDERRQNTPVSSFPCQGQCWSLLSAVSERSKAGLSQIIFTAHEYTYIGFPPSLLTSLLPYQCF